jgi:hypothetical protein
MGRKVALNKAIEQRAEEARARSKKQQERVKS